MRLESYRPRLQPDGSIRQARMRIGYSIVMIGELVGKFRPMPPSLDLYGDDMDPAYEHMLQAGPASLMEPADSIYENCNAGIERRGSGF